MRYNYKLQEFHIQVLDVLFWGLEASHVALNVLHGGLGVNTVNTEFKKKLDTSLVRSSKPWIRIRNWSRIRIRIDLVCSHWNQCGFTILVFLLGSLFCLNMFLPKCLPLACMVVPNLIISQDSPRTFCSLEQDSVWCSLFRGRHNAEEPGHLSSVNLHLYNEQINSLLPP